MTGNRKAIVKSNKNNDLKDKKCLFLAESPDVFETILYVCEKRKWVKDILSNKLVKNSSRQYHSRCGFAF